MAEVDEPDRHARKARHRVCSDAPKTSQSVANAEAAGGRRTAAGNATIRVSDDGRRSRFGPCRASAVLCMHMMAAAPVKVVQRPPGCTRAAAQPLRHCAIHPIVRFAELFVLTDGLAGRRAAAHSPLSEPSAASRSSIAATRQSATSVFLQTAERLHRCALAAEWERIAQRWS